MFHLHNPLNKQQKSVRIKRLALEYCMSCKKNMGDPKKGTHGCEECWVYFMMNEIAGTNDDSD